MKIPTHGMKIHRARHASSQAVLAAYGFETAGSETVSACGRKKAPRDKQACLTRNGQVGDRG